MPMPCISDGQPDRKLVIIGYSQSINNCHIFKHLLSNTYPDNFSVIWIHVHVLNWLTKLVSYKICIHFFSEKKNEIRISCEYSHVHSMHTLIIKLPEILLSGFRWDALTNCFSSMFNFGQTFRFKWGIIPRNKIESQFSANLRIYTV